MPSWIPHSGFRETASSTQSLWVETSSATECRHLILPSRVVQNLGSTSNGGHLRFECR
jgi:hypothetical protein